MKALFVQIEQKKSGAKVTSWWQDFSYSESCRNVYVNKSVHKNGMKSTLPAFAKASGRTVDDIPYILTANTFFWSPAGNASQRRRNEEYREKEIESFMIDNRNEAEQQLNRIFAEYIAKGERIKVDNLGAFLQYRGHDYHFPGMITKKSIEETREAIRERRLKDVKAYRLQKLQKEERLSLAKKTFVTIEDSLAAGNCEVGTMNFYNNLSIVKKGFHLRALRADVLLQIRNDDYTNRAVNTALKRTV